MGELVEVLHHDWAWIFSGPARLVGMEHYEWILVSWVVIGFLVWLARQATADLSLFPSGLQNVAETVYEAIEGMVKSVIGEEGRAYVPLIGTFFIYIFTLNAVGLIPGFTSPTANLNTTVALAVTAFVVVQCIAVYKTGIKAYFLHLCGEPLWMAPLLLPVHVVGELAKPMSLSLRLFGNIFGEDQIIINLAALALILQGATLVPIPIHFPLVAFGLFTSFVQALIFSILVSIYILLFVEEHHEGHGEHAGEGGHH